MVRHLAFLLQAAHKIAVSCQDVLVALFPGPCRFQLHEERACDVRGRKVVERSKLNVDTMGLRTARRAKVLNLPHVSS